MRKNMWGKTIVFSAAAALAALATAPAQADQATFDPGWYINLNGGFNSLSKADNTVSNSTSTPSTTSLNILGLIAIPAGTPLDPLLNPLAGALCPTPLGALLCATGGSTTTVTGTSQTVKFKGGSTFGLGFGYQAANGLRPEFELSYRNNDIESAVTNVTTTTTTGGVTSAPTTTSITATNVAGKAQSYGAIGNLWYDFAPTAGVDPYIGAGLGATKVQYKDFSGSNAGTAFGPINKSSTVFSWQLGAGVNFKVTDHTRLSIDYRYLAANNVAFDFGGGTELDTSYKNNSIMLGMHYAFGSWSGKNPKCPNAPKGVPMDAEGCPLDSDGDGVPDYMDKCPNTPAGVKVDANGCELDSDGDGVPDSRDQCPNTPKGVAVDTNGCPLDSDGDGVPDYLDKCPNTPKGTVVDANGCPALDSDGDGVPDYLDKCPNTPKGVQVDANGCPLDSDGDGIPDYLDECPHTPAGAKILPNGCAPVGDCRKPRPGEEVDANGCALEKTFILRGVKFEFDSDRLTQDAKKILDGVATTLNNYPEINVELGGHTDNIGTDAYNLGLSERRSNSVKNYLTGKGVAAARMNPVGYGETQPIATNDTEEGREENRRVELKVIEQTQ
ncbi:MAG TPA: thrombospondin type 3 repeat-containing protein [Nevskiaceae bacterium]|nr:thrombospondin type 3 repeat-containing protein [Nevskiaceae bacterium]